jgi:hypothetical protein
VQGKSSQKVGHWQQLAAAGVLRRFVPAAVGLLQRPDRGAAPAAKIGSFDMSFQLETALTTKESQKPQPRRRPRETSWGTSNFPSRCAYQTPAATVLSTTKRNGEYENTTVGPLRRTGTDGLSGINRVSPKSQVASE